MNGPPYNRRHDVAVMNEGRIDWQWACLTCGAVKAGYLSMTACEDAADEHALSEVPEVSGGAA